MKKDKHEWVKQERDNVELFPEEIQAIKEYDAWFQSEIERLEKLGDQIALDQLYEDNK